MPTTTQEVLRIREAIDRRLSSQEASGLFNELYDEVGAKSTNESVKTSLLMLKALYSGASPEQLERVFASYGTGESHWLAKTCLGLVVVAHFVLLLAMLAALFVLPFVAHWAVALPLMVFLLNMLTTPVTCAMTKLENVCRRAAGLPTIRFFVQHYVLSPMLKTPGS
jgi:hypothetical protein